MVLNLLTQTLNNRLLFSPLSTKGSNTPGGNVLWLRKSFRLQGEEPRDAVYKCDGKQMQVQSRPKPYLIAVNSSCDDATLFVIVLIGRHYALYISTSKEPTIVLPYIGYVFPC